MDKSDEKAKEIYLKDMDRLWKKYFDKMMNAPINSWRFKASIDVRMKITEIKQHLENLEIS